MLHLRFWLAVWVACLATVSAADPKPAKLTVFAASSLTNVLPKVASAWQRSGGHQVTFSFDGSSRLAKQIKEGAPADLYISANGQWMDFLEQAGQLGAKSRRDLLKNELVLAVPKGSPLLSENLPDLQRFDFTSLPRLALAGENVPAGLYGKAALQSISAWETVQDRLIRGSHVRTVLAWLATGEIPAGIVYRTDVRAVAAKVEIVATFAADSHPPIVYPAAVIKGSASAAAARDFLAFCHSPQAQSIFSAAGFQTVDAN
jgi:molybdate transport system substrate-binding protein